MSMVDMKLPKRTAKEIEKDMCVPSTMEGDEYPYGLKLNFDTDQVDKLPVLETMSAEDRVAIVAEGCITRVEVEQRKGGKDRKSYTIQIEKISVEPFKKKPLEKMSPKEYKATRGV